jgi:hypothetical protein
MKANRRPEVGLPFLFVLRECSKIALSGVSSLPESRIPKSITGLSSYLTMGCYLDP